MAWVQFSKKDIYVNKATLLIFGIFIKFYYFIGTNILQIVFDFITNSIATFVLPKESLTYPQLLFHKSVQITRKLIICAFFDEHLHTSRLVNEYSLSVRPIC